MPAAPGSASSAAPDEFRLAILTPMLATFVIFLREGIEASMIVAVLLAYLDKIGQRRHFRDIFIGCGLAILLATEGRGRLFDDPGLRRLPCADDLRDLHLSPGSGRAHLHGRSGCAAMPGRSRPSSGSEPSGRWRGGSGFGLGFLAFRQWAGRDSRRPYSRWRSSSAAGSDTHYAIAGGALGLAAALAVAFSIYRLGRRLNFGRFFSPSSGSSSPSSPPDSSPMPQRTSSSSGG